LNEVHGALPVDGAIGIAEDLLIRGATFESDQIRHDVTLYAAQIASYQCVIGARE